MPQGFIKRIDKITERRLKSLGLRPRKPLSEFIEKDKRFYTTPCFNQKGEQVLFKIIIGNKREDQLKEKMKREVNLTNFLSRFSKERGLNILPLVEYDVKHFPFWYVREYLPGPLLGYHFDISKQGLKKENQKQIIENLCALQKIPKKIKLPLKKAPDYLGIVKLFENELKLKNREKEIDFKRAYQFIENQKKYLNKNLVLAHGDFTLANFFVNKGKVYLTDFEHLRVDGFAADLARLFIQTYRYAKWQKEIVRAFLNKLTANKKNDFKQAFRTIVLVEAIAEFFCAVLGQQNQTKKQRRQYYKKTIRSAIKGFDYLI